MRVDIITCLPQLVAGPFEHSIFKRAINQGLLDLHIHNLHDYSVNKHRKVDDYAYGGEAGMVLCIEPIVQCIRHLQAQTTYQEIIYRIKRCLNRQIYIRIGIIVCRIMTHGFTILQAKLKRKIEWI